MSFGTRKRPTAPQACYPNPDVLPVPVTEPGAATTPGIDATLEVPVKAVFLGATRGMGRALARCMAERGDEIFLLGRNPNELAQSAQDLEIRGASGTVGHAPCDLADPSCFEGALDAAEGALERIDTIVVTAGLFATQDALEKDLAQAERLMTVNFTNTVLFCERARTRLLAQEGGNLVVFSSVAGDRGRKPVAIYGAAKAGLSHYLESLDHTWRDAGLATITVKPGFVHTSMTTGLKPPPFAGEPGEVAKRVLRAIDRTQPVVYAPMMWQWVMMVIRALPRFVMRRVGF